MSVQPAPPIRPPGMGELWERGWIRISASLRILREIPGTGRRVRRMGKSRAWRVPPSWSRWALRVRMRMRPHFSDFDLGITSPNSSGGTFGAAAVWPRGAPGARFTGPAGRGREPPPRTIPCPGRTGAGVIYAGLTSATPLHPVHRKRPCRGPGCCVDHRPRAAARNFQAAFPYFPGSP